MTESIELLKDVHLNYDEIEVLKGFTLEIPYKKITCIVGPSGCGKTSILNILAGLEENYSGVCHTESEKIGYIFQEDRLLPWETVYKNIQIVGKEENKEEINELLKTLGLKDFKDKYPDQLSGGMRQRCAIARGFYYHSTLLLMDEPFKSLDYDLRLNLVKYLSFIWKMKKNTIVFVTHDIDEALLLGHQILVLSERPSKIAKRINLLTPHEKRSIMDEEHVHLRGQIIYEMSH